MSECFIRNGVLNRFRQQEDAVPDDAPEVPSSVEREASPRPYPSRRCAPECLEGRESSQVPHYSHMNLVPSDKESSISSSMTSSRRPSVETVLQDKERNALGMEEKGMKSRIVETATMEKENVPFMTDPTLSPIRTETQCEMSFPDLELAAEPKRLSINLSTPREVPVQTPVVSQKVENDRYAQKMEKIRQLHQQLQQTAVTSTIIEEEPRAKAYDPLSDTLTPSPALLVRKNVLHWEMARCRNVLVSSVGNFVVGNTEEANRIIKETHSDAKQLAPLQFALGSVGASEGKFSFSVQVGPDSAAPLHPCFGVGLTTSHYTRDPCDTTAFLFFSRGEVGSDGNYLPYGTTFKGGDRVGVHVDFEKGSISFSVNDHRFGTAFKLVLPSRPIQLYPLVVFGREGEWACLQ
ncbi:SPRY domain containing protein, putative [Angomonas deanei]|uniref:SPRY domain containing protein, putative n=1 Tax=Angomonas deanei TaxID=59799 RepID=A0A7G2CCC0_9TRYP|nr:SPRY domain containing protein, putative [Angomonas deanei]